MYHFSSLLIDVVFNILILFVALLSHALNHCITLRMLWCYYLITWWLCHLFIWHCACSSIFCCLLDHSQFLSLNRRSWHTCSECSFSQFCVCQAFSQFLQGCCCLSKSNSSEDANGQDPGVQPSATYNQTFPAFISFYVHCLHAIRALIMALTAILPHNLYSCS